MKVLPLISLLSIVLLVTVVPAQAHKGEDHQDQGITVNPESTSSASNTPLPVDLGGPFELIDHFGRKVSNESYEGEHMLVFFGYTDCQVMCSISLSRIGEALKILEQKPALFTKLNALVVTVDPDNDTPAVMRTGLEKYHPSLVGLTGSSEQLSGIYKAYKQKPVLLEEKIGDSPIISHSSYFYLMGPDGDLQTFFPPILNADSMVAILEKYLSRQS
ncbi:MAG: SCO family protein [Acidiferrobacterales bacterium]|nr:SCO family protein [Acidiferrobacterales bacterium]